MGLTWVVVRQVAKVVAPKVGMLTCVEPSSAIKVAKKNLNKNKNIKFIKSSIKNIKLVSGSQILDIV